MNTAVEAAVVAKPIRDSAAVRLTLAPTPGGWPLDGAWWPRSRDLDRELADLVDHFPASAGHSCRMWLLVVPPGMSTETGQRLMMLAASPTNSKSATALLMAAERHSRVDTSGHWSDDGGALARPAGAYGTEVPRRSGPMAVPSGDQTP